jgi:phage terminase Nu1 subunit (DNA packaging protein)
MSRENLTSVQIGEFCGISDRTIRDWQKKKIIPSSGDMSEIVKAILAYQQQIVRTKKSEPTELNEAKVRLTNLQSDKLELELEVRRGNLLESFEVVETWSKYIYACKSRLTGIPAKLAYELSGIEDPMAIKQVLERGVDEVLRELSDHRED